MTENSREENGEAIPLEMQSEGVASDNCVENSVHVEVESLTQPQTGIDLLYGVDDVPPVYLSICLGFQHYMTMIGPFLIGPFILASAMCIGDDNVSLSELVGTMCFVAGLVTILQSTVGSRLPVIQGNAMYFILPTLAILNLEKWKCPDTPFIHENESSTNGSHALLIGSAEHREIWQTRMREIQGAIMVAALIQAAISLTGAFGLLMRFIGPIVIGPTIITLGLSLYPVTGRLSSTHWGIAVLTVLFVTIFSQYLKKVTIPFCKTSASRQKISCQPFQKCPVILAVFLSWIVCCILTYANALPSDPGKYGYKARVDIKLDGLRYSKWFRIPYPFQWGMPTFSVGAILGMSSAILVGLIDSVGDYYAYASVSGAPPPPAHAVNRGLFIEAAGTVIGSIVGTGTGLGAYSVNIGTIGLSKVGSRRVAQFAGLILLLSGILGKFGAVFIAIPDPIVGGLLIVTAGMLAAVGISTLQHVDLNSMRNLFILGLSILFGVLLPWWLSSNKGAIKSGNETIDQTATIFLSCNMLVAGVVAAILDNTIPGTPNERGITNWSKNSSSALASRQVERSTYDLPFVMRYIKKWTCTKYIPLCPTFDYKLMNPRCKRPKLCTKN